MPLEALAKKEEDLALSEKDVKEYIAPNATKKELFMFLGMCKSYNLNPFKREVHFVKYGNNPGQTIVGYEIYLKRAEKTGKLNGWVCDVTNDGEAAEITIWRKDRDQPFIWKVDRSEFDKKQSTWKSMPNFMLKKVAIAQGFRLCFPEELGGMPYIPEEIPNGEPIEVKPEPALPPSIDISEEVAQDREWETGYKITIDLYNGLTQQQKESVWDKFKMAIKDMDTKQLRSCWNFMDKMVNGGASNA